MSDLGHIHSAIGRPILYAPWQGDEELACDRLLRGYVTGLLPERGAAVVRVVSRHGNARIRECTAQHHQRQDLNATSVMPGGVFTFTDPHQWMASKYLTEQDQAEAELRALRRRRDEAKQQLEQREYLRHEIAARTHVKDLETIALCLFSGKEAQLDSLTKEVVLVPLDNDRTKQLLGAANVKQALLKKVLPDIKSIELTGAGGEDLGTDRKMAEIELRNRLRAILTGDSLPAVIEGVSQRVEEQSYDFLE